MKPGTVVQFKEPLNEEERRERFLVLEDREERLLVQDLALAHWPIPPTAVYRKSDLMPTTDPMPNLYGKCSTCDTVYYVGSWDELNRPCPRCAEVPVKYSQEEIDGGDL